MDKEAVFLSARWLSLAMLSYEIDPGVLSGYVPVGTELDDWNGRVFVSLVGFRFLDTRVCGVPVPFHRNFDEVNLRFYVRRWKGGELRRGVVFIKEIVPHFAISWVARRFYNENYVTRPMRHAVALPGDGSPGGGRVSYEWRGGAGWDRMSVEMDCSGEGADIPRIPGDGSVEAFIAEHYWGYARQGDGSTKEYEVEHPRWRVWGARSSELVCDVAGLYGEAWSGCLRGEPFSAFVAEGSEVVVRRGVVLG